MRLPQYILLTLYVASFCLFAHRHGKTVSKKFNFWEDLLGSVLTLALLYWGGFFHH